MARTGSAQASRALGSNPEAVSDAATRDPDDPPDADRPDPETAAARIRARGEAVRRRELAAALDRLEACGEVSEAERTAVARLSARVTAAFVERWASTVADGRADPASALELVEP